MSELEVKGSAYGTELYDAEESVGQFAQIAYIKQRDETRPRMKAFYQWLHGSLDDPVVREPIRDMFEFRPTMRVLYGFNLASRALWAITAKSDDDFALKRTKPEDWEPTRELLRDPDCVEELSVILCTKEITSTKRMRFTPIKVILAAAGIESPRLVDMGCSQAHSLVLASEDSGYDPDLEVGKITPEGWQSDKEDSERFRDIVFNSPLNLSFGLGIDIHNPDDEVNIRWAKASSYYLDERLDVDELKEFERLSDPKRRPDNIDICYGVSFTASWERMRVDLDQIIQRRAPKTPRSFRANAAIFSYSLYEAVRSSPDELQTALANADYITSDSGLTLIADSLSVENGVARFHDNSLPNVHTIHMKDKNNLEAGLQRIMTATTGRMGKIVLEEAFYDLPRAAELGFKRS